MRIGIAGARSTIATEFIKLLPSDVEHECDRLYELSPLEFDRYLICTGFLAGKALGCLTVEESDLTWRRNFMEPARFCERVFAANPDARVCLIGSRSGLKGSFDMAYAGAKAALHLYVETKKLGPQQQLVALAPTVIWDSGMTQRRNDLAELKARGEATVRGRWLNAADVAAEAFRALCGPTPFPSNTVVHIECGE